MCFNPFYIINTSEVGVIERFGKYSGLSQAGLGCALWPISSLAGRLSFRVQQLNVRVETKTLDNVFSK
jgi:regulator of protease activity HflC (stomatin/prohibitin superfamily)